MSDRRGVGWGVVLGAFALMAACGGTSKQKGPDERECKTSADCEPDEACELGRCLESSGIGGGGGEGAGDGLAGVGAAPLGGAAGDAPIGGADGVACEPGERSCDGLSVRVCNGAGDGTVVEELCSLSQICQAGECRKIVCVPGAQFCEADELRECGADGASSVRVTLCESGYCSDEGETAACSDTPCEPDAKLCSGSRATVCKPDGSGPLSSGEDCAQSGQVCVAGECRGVLCAAGERFCQHDDVQVCSPDGASLSLFADCGELEVCDPELAVCRAKLCEPGKLGCDASRVVQCSSLGTAWQQTGVDCGEQDKICHEGSCRAQVCEPSTTFCEGGDVYTCDALGLKATRSSDCGAGQHCAFDDYYGAFCASNVCSPNALACSYDGLVISCNADGSGYLPGGTSCGAGKACKDGSCQTKQCEPYQYFCKNADIYYCYGDSISSFLSLDCPTSSRCVQSNGSIACEPLACTPGQTACVGNVIGTCDQVGAAIGTVEQDCLASGEVCVSTSACAASVTDTFGASDELQSLSQGYSVGDFVDVYSSRKLTELQANLVLPSTRTLRWLVYERGQETYEQVLDVATSSSGSGFFSSGALSYTLQAGKTYFFAVEVSGGGFGAFYDVQPPGSLVSFGRFRGGLARYYTSSIYSPYHDSSMYGLKLTTSAP